MKTDREAPQASRRKTAIAETGSNRPDGRISEMDRAAGFEIGPDFMRFDQINDIFSRAFWDDRVKSADTDAFLTVIAARRRRAAQTALHSVTLPSETRHG